MFDEHVEFQHSNMWEDSPEYTIDPHVDNDAINYAIMASGGAGFTSVTSNLLPDLTSKLAHEALIGNFEAAKKISNSLYEINSAMFCESNPIPIKAAMYIAGLIDTLEYRLPLTPPSAENMKLLEKVMKNYNIVK